MSPYEKVNSEPLLGQAVLIKSFVSFIYFITLKNIIQTSVLNNTLKFDQKTTSFLML